MQGTDPHDVRMGDGFETDVVTSKAALARADAPAQKIGETTDEMDIRKPKPIHSWREFLGEIGIIVIGVLLALAGEQTVEALHHRSQVAELSEALDLELSHNLAVLKDTVELRQCIGHRLTEIANWSRSASQSRPLTGDFDRWPGEIFLTAIWRSTGTSVELLPLKERISYARFYDNFANVDQIRDAMRNKWSDIASFEGAVTLTDHERLQITHDIRDIERANERLFANYTSVKDRLALQLHIVPQKNGESATTATYLNKRRAEFCNSSLIS
jgi:hypothetical protein